MTSKINFKSKGKQIYFELAGGSSYQGFELLWVNWCTYMYSQLLPCGHPVITDTRYYRQYPALHPAKDRGLTENDSLLQTLAITDSKPRPEGVRYNEYWELTVHDM